MSFNLFPTPMRLQKHDELVAIKNYSKKKQNEINLLKDDKLLVHEVTMESDRYVFENMRTSEKGFVPLQFVKKVNPKQSILADTSNEKKKITVHKMPWFHGKISREEAEALLKPKKSPNGTYLVRESTNYPGDYTLCVCCTKKVEHYRIHYKNSRLTVDEEEYFDTLNDLVKFYTDYPDAGLCSPLIHPLICSDQFEFFLNKKEFDQAGWVIHPTALEYSSSDIIGKGEFADVYKGFYSGGGVTPRKVAIKILKNTNQGSSMQTFLREAQVMTQLQHPNLVQLIGVVVADQICMVTEFLEKGNLVDFLRSRGRSVIIQEKLVQFALDVCSGMQLLEQKALVHRDLAARNVLLSDAEVAKIADFGLARLENSNQHLDLCPIKWTAPEAVQEGKFSNKSDMWSFGILLWEIFSFGRVPYPRILLKDVVKVVKEGYRMEPPENCPPGVYSIMKAAWSNRPEKRPNFTEAHDRLQKVLQSLQGS